MSNDRVATPTKLTLESLIIALVLRGKVVFLGLVNI